jgi:hypothetical protein
MITPTEPPIIPVGQEPPPLHRVPSDNGNHRHQDKAKGKPARRKTGDRFAVLNAFVDAGMAGLSKVEALTWLVLYRDTRDSTACTCMESIAARVGCSKRAVIDAVQRLRRRGLLVQVFKGGINRGPSRYRVLSIPKPPKEQGK